MPSETLAPLNFATAVHPDLQRFPIPHSPQNPHSQQTNDLDQQKRATQPGYCLVGKIPPPWGGGGWVGVEMGGWVSPKFQHFGPPGTPPPPGVRVRFFWDLGCAGL